MSSFIYAFRLNSVPRKWGLGPGEDTGKPLFLIARVTNSEQSPETQAPRAGALYARYETEGRRSCAPDKAERVFGIRNNRAPLIFLRKLPSQPVPPLI